MYLTTSGEITSHLLLAPFGKSVEKSMNILKVLIFYHLENKDNVVAVHCNHGKGRTGTTIISFLMFIGFF